MAKLLEAGQNLRFMYNASCDGGRKARNWEQALAPAEVQTFGRLSAVAETLAVALVRGSEAHPGDGVAIFVSQCEANRLFADPRGAS